MSFADWVVVAFAAIGFFATLILIIAKVLSIGKKASHKRIQAEEACDRAQEANAGREWI